MQLVEYQEKIQKDIYHLIVDKEIQQIFLCGESGCGKSCILYSLQDVLLEDWKVIYIIGAGRTSSPYMAWYNDNFTLLGGMPRVSLQNVTIGFQGIPVLPSFEFEVQLSIDKKVSSLNTTEISLLDEIQKCVKGNSHLLIIAEDYDEWDPLSVSFLKKILRYNSKLLPCIKTFCIFSLANIPKLNFDDLPNKAISILSSDISDSDIIEILHKNQFHKDYDIERIRQFSGVDLNLIMMIADYYDQTGNYDGNNDIYQKRYSYYNSKKRSACEMLKPLTLTGGCFSTDEAIFFSSSIGEMNNETMLNAEENLSFAKNENIISGEKDKLFFQNHAVKEVFKSQIAKNEKRYHMQFCTFLKKCHPEDYYNRAFHQIMSITLENTDQIKEAWQLMMLYYIRSIAASDDLKLQKAVLSEIDNLIMRIGELDIQDKQRTVYYGIYKAFSEYKNWEYEKTIAYLELIHTEQLSTFLLAEYVRIKLVCLTQLAKNKKMVREIADNLLDIVTSDGFEEDEVACQALLVLMNIYYDHTPDASKCRIVSRRLDQILQKHYRNRAFAYFNMIKNRKATLLFSAPIAMGCTRECVIDAEKSGNIYERFFAYCNHAGNAIVAGDYIGAKDVLRKADELQKKPYLQFPSVYKIENNRLLLEYLTKERNVKDEDAFIELSVNMLDKFEKLLFKQGEEVSHVIELNCLSLKYISGNIDINLVLNLLDDVGEDAYYAYFLHDILLADAIISKNQEEAQAELHVLKELDVPLLKEERYILNERNKIQKSILIDFEAVELTPYHYHRLISDGCSKIQDPSCYFWGRGFLLSDLQYLSFN